MGSNGTLSQVKENHILEMESSHEQSCSILENQEIIDKIQSAKSFLEGYRGYGQMVDDAINAMSRLQELIGEPTSENLDEAMDIANSITQQLSPYRYMVPSLASTLDEVTGWLKEKTGS